MLARRSAARPASYTVDWLWLRRPKQLLASTVGAWQRQSKGGQGPQICYHRRVRGHANTQQARPGLCLDVSAAGSHGVVQQPRSASQPAQSLLQIATDSAAPCPLVCLAACTNVARGPRPVCSPCAGPDPRCHVGVAIR
jgi:hypothetical protein